MNSKPYQKILKQNIWPTVCEPKFPSSDAMQPDHDLKKQTNKKKHPRNSKLNWIELNGNTEYQHQTRIRNNVPWIHTQLGLWLGLGQTTFILLYWLAIVHHPAYYTTIQQINMLTWNIQHWLIEFRSCTAVQQWLILKTFSKTSPSSDCMF